MLAASQAALLDFFGLNGLAWLHRSMWFLNGSAAICTDAKDPKVFLGMATSKFSRLWPDELLGKL